MRGYRHHACWTSPRLDLLGPCGAQGVITPLRGSSQVFAIQAVSSPDGDSTGRSRSPCGDLSPLRPVALFPLGCGDWVWA